MKKKPSSSHQPSNNRFPDWFSAVTALLVCTLIAGFGIFREFRHQQAITPAPASATGIQLKKVNVPNAFFYTKIFLNRDKTFISLPYKFDGSTQTVWLYLLTKPNSPTITRLVTHPALENLSWPRLSDGALSLYQKKPVYTSMAGFLKKPPIKVRILADPQIRELPLYQKLKTEPLPDDPKDINLDQVDYILTTYVPSRAEGNLKYYETVIDAAKADLNDKNELVWQLYAPFVTQDSPLYVSDIHIDYRQ